MGLRWLKACKNPGMLSDMTPPINMARERNTEVTLTAKPVWENRVLKTIPRLSPQFTMAKALKATMKKSWTVRCRPTAKTASTEKSKDVKISKGISASVYCRKKASTL